MEGVLGAFAQFDNDVRSDRTRAGMRAALELGRWTFPAPLGYLNAPKWSNTSLVHDSERGPLRRAFEDLATGQYRKQEVIARATEAELRSRKGLRLLPQSLGQMMRNPTGRSSEGRAGNPRAFPGTPTDEHVFHRAAVRQPRCCGGDGRSARRMRTIGCQFGCQAYRSRIACPRTCCFSLGKDGEPRRNRTLPAD